jgi:hypothetical protein
MRTSILTLLVVFFGASAARSDDPTEPTPLIFTPEWSGHVCFCMVPRQYAEPDRKVIREPYGILYRLKPDGKMEEVYRTEGWYSFKVHVSHDGRYLVQMGPWTSGSEVSEKHLAIAFHKDGKLIKRYSTINLVKDPDQLEYSVSHYRWLAPGLNQKLTDAQKDALWPKLDYHNKFTLNTLDGWTYVFDATNGEITSTTKTKG